MIELTEEYREKLHTLRLAMSRGRVSKQQIMTYFGVGEREARRMTSIISWVYPLVSVSDRKGGKIATDSAELEDVVHALRENLKRMREISKRNAPLVKFMRQMGCTEAYIREIMQGEQTDE